MGEQTLFQFFAIFSWFPLVGLLFFLVLIGRFYQRFSGRQTYYRWYSLPVILFGISSIHYASTRQVAGVPGADMLMGLGGLILLILCTRLYYVMLYRRK